MGSLLRIPVQPIITTYATSFLYTGLALYILPDPGGGIPAEDCRDLWKLIPIGIPLAFYVIGTILLVWWYLYSTRFGKYLYAVGGEAQRHMKRLCL